MFDMHLTERSNLNLNGIVDVKSFDESTILCKTEEDGMIITGENLHIDVLDLPNLKLEISGKIDSFKFTKAYVINENFWEKLFK